MCRTHSILVALAFLAFLFSSGCKSPTESPIGNAKGPEPVAIATQEPKPVDEPAKAEPAPADATAKSESAPTTEPPAEDKPMIATVPNAEPDFITVQHILIGFKGSVPGKNIIRTKEEAEALAKEVLAMAQAADADFDALVKKYTNDSPPGIYKMANSNVKTGIPAGVYPRHKMVAAFGDVGFPLQVGQVGLANHDPEKSRFGWHIIKRIK